jgi:hypothetical protein
MDTDDLSVPDSVIRNFRIAAAEGKSHFRVDKRRPFVYSLFANRERRMPDDSQAPRCFCVA